MDTPDPSSAVPIETLIAEIRASLLIATKAHDDIARALTRIDAMLEQRADETGSTPPDPGATQGV